MCRSCRVTRIENVIIVDINFMSGSYSVPVLRYETERWAQANKNRDGILNKYGRETRRG
jgi:hypothetical protein